MCESTIRADSPVVTLINVFTVEPENQDRLIEAWQRSTDEVWGAPLRRPRWST